MVLGEAALMAFLLPSYDESLTAPLVCVLMAVCAVWALLAARRRAPDDPPGGRAYLVLGGGLGFAALSCSTLILVFVTGP